MTDHTVCTAVVSSERQRDCGVLENVNDGLIRSLSEEVGH